MVQQVLSSPSVVKNGGSMNFAAGIPIIGDILNYFSNQSTNAANAQMVADTNASNLRIAQETNAMNQAINEQNIALTREQNAINREREDNAVRRRANDLVGAGLSKTLAAGSPASANAMQAPQATQGMVTGHEMKSARFSPFHSENLATAGRLAQESIIADKEIAVKEKQLDLDALTLDEQIRHNKETEAQGSRSLDISEAYREQENFWNKQYFDQNSEFHKDAVRLEDAKNRISYLNYLSQDSLREVQELWYQADADLTRVTIEQNAKRLTADLALSSAKIAEIMSGVKLNDYQIKMLGVQAKYYAAATVEALCRARGYSAEVKDTLINVVTKAWNLVVARREGTPSGGSVPSSSEKAENTANRHTSLVNGIGRTLFMTGAGVFLGAGGGSFIRKVLGMDDYDPFGMRSLK